MSATRSFYESLIDYAGLFPPAALDLPTVIKNYHEYFGSSDSWMLARLIIPAGRLAEVSETAQEYLPKSDSAKPWRISALAPPAVSDDPEFANAIKQIDQFNKRHSTADNGLSVVDAIEVKAPTAEHQNNVVTGMRSSFDFTDPETVDVFMELPHKDDPQGLVESLRELVEQGNSNLRAKIRTGGVTPDLIPGCDKVARFIARCAKHRVGFKATAGLHHPLRNEFNLTYESDSPRATMHGYINVFAASLAAFIHDASVDQIEQILDFRTPGDFVFEDDWVTVSDFKFSASQIADVRKSGVVSFGSCSFTEPVSEKWV